MNMKLRRCTRCGAEKLLEADFYYSKNSKKRRNTICKLCVKEAARKHRRTNLHHVQNIERRSKWKNNYGINFTETAYDRKFFEQKGCCMICGKHQLKFKDRLCVDHDHDTGQVRGLLCHLCNTLVGQLENRTETIAKARKYLSYWKKQENSISVA